MTVVSLSKNYFLNVFLTGKYFFRVEDEVNLALESSTLSAKATSPWKVTIQSFGEPIYR